MRNEKTIARARLYRKEQTAMEARLIVEADGPSHRSDERIASGATRTEFLERAGWRVLRIPNDLVRVNIGMVGKAIEEALAASPSPPRGGEGGA